MIDSIQETMKELQSLQEMCDHEFEDRYCKWCDKKED
nr:MAG TPA: Putative zinc ribbon domain [Caudoviricetes sp.]